MWETVGKHTIYLSNGRVKNACDEDAGSDITDPAEAYFGTGNPLNRLENVSIIEDQIDSMFNFP